MKTLVLVVISVASLSAQIGRRPARPQVIRPDGPVWQVIRKNCTSCHGIDDYAFYALDRMGWQKLIEDKHKDGGAALSDADRGLLLDWLVQKFGPATKPFPRTYIPPEITTFFSDPEAKRLLDRACTKCHGIEMFANIRLSRDEWKYEVDGMIARGAKATRAEARRIVDYLAKNLGPLPSARK